MPPAESHVAPAPPLEPGAWHAETAGLPDSARRVAVTILGWLALGVVLVVGVPLFLCMPLCVDVDYFGNYVRSLQRGELLYRDLFFLQPPGFVLAQYVTRSLLGWRSEAVRLADLMVLGGVIG